jgi:hypothetical protein
MSFVTCDECGTQNERPSSAEADDGAGAAYLYCRACANRIELRAEPVVQSEPASESVSPSGGSGDLLDELLSMPLADPHPPHRHAEAPTDTDAPGNAALANNDSGAAVADGSEPASVNEPTTIGEPTSASVSEPAPTTSAAIMVEPLPPALSIAESPESAAEIPIVLADASPGPIEATDPIAPPDGVIAPSPTPVAAPIEVTTAEAVPASIAPPRVSVPRPSDSARKTSPAEATPSARRSEPSKALTGDAIAAVGAPESTNMAAAAPTAVIEPAPMAVIDPAPIAAISPAPIAVIEPSSDATQTPPAPPAPPAKFDSVEELSWELPSPVPPPAALTETRTNTTATEAPAVDERANAPLAAVLETSEPSPPASAPTASDSAEPSSEPSAVALNAAEPSDGEPQATEPAAALDSSATEAIVTNEQPAAITNAEPAARQRISVPPPLPQTALESSAANIRATLPFGPTLPARETVPVITTEAQLEIGRAETAEAPPPPPPPPPIPASQGRTNELRVEPVASAAAVAPAPAAASAVSAAFAIPASAQVARTTSDAPTTHSWAPPAPSPSKLRRFAPLGAALAAIAAAFVGGIQVGKMNPNAPPARAAAAAMPAPPAPRPAAAEVVAPPPTATSVPASASTASERPEGASATTRVAHGKPLPAFSTKAANAALAQVNSRARACKKPGSPGGTALAMVTFGTSGRVEDVTVSGARIAGTPIATCIAAVLSTAKVQPFAGNAQTVKRAVKID